MEWNEFLYLGDVGTDTLIRLIRKLVNEAISSITIDNFVVVETLPDKGEEGKIYFVPDKDASEGNVFKEYMWVNDAWELIGSTTMSISLDGYVHDVEATSSNNGVHLSARIDENGKLIISMSIDEATAEEAGLMSATDKSKLDAINVDDFIKGVDFDGVDAPLSFKAEVNSEGVVVVTGGMTQASATTDGYITSELYNQIQEVIENPLMNAKAATAADIDTWWDEEMNK